MHEVVQVFPGYSGASTFLLRDARGGLRVRKSADGPAALKLEAQAQWYSRGEFNLRTPRVLGTSRRGSQFTIDLEYLKGTVSLDRRLLELSEEKARELFTSVVNSLFVSLQALGATIEDTAVRDLYLQEKILSKVQFAADRLPTIARLLQEDRLNINGREYRGFYAALAELRSNESLMASLARYRPAPLHGDLTLQNILVGNDGFYFIDPNGDNGLSTPLVDFAKLLQSLDSGYEFLLKLEDFSVNGAAISYGGHIPARWIELKRVLVKLLALKFTPVELSQLPFHQAAHLARLIPYQVESNPERVVLFFSELVRKLGDFLDGEECV